MNFLIPKNTEVIAFDFFDTLVHRTVHPEVNLFKWAKEISLELDCEIEANQIYRIRKNCESALMSKAEDSSYSELLDSVFLKLASLGDINCSQKKFVELSYELEEKIELDSIYLNSDILPILDKAKESNKRLIIISDFYCGSDLLRSALEKIDLQGYFSEIYVSSEWTLRKSSGNLFRKVLSEQKLKPSDLLMVGDNVKSDYEIPQSMGIRCFHIKFEEKNKEFNTKKDICKELKNISFKHAESEPFDGYASEIYYFVETLYCELIRNNINQISFCSREGQFLKRAFDFYQETKIKKIKTYYFYTSRKVTLTASLEKFDNEKFQSVFRQYEELTLSDFLSSISFSNDERKEVYQQTNLTGNTMIIAGKTAPVFSKLAKNKFFTNLYDQKRVEQKRLLTKYIKAQTDPKTNTFVMVDIGWKGTMQNNLAKVISSTDIAIYGYYWGLILADQDYKKNKKGIMFQNVSPISENFHIFSQNYLVYEKIFSANHGPVNGYTEDSEDNVVPVFSESAEDLNLYNYVSTYQENLYSTFRHIVNVLAESLYGIDELREIITKLSLRQKCIISPEKWEIQRHMNQSVKENFGNISNRGIDKAAKNKLGSSKRFLKVSAAYRKPQQLLKSGILNSLSLSYCYLVYVFNLFLLAL